MSQGRKSLPIMLGCSTEPRAVRHDSREFAVRGSILRVCTFFASTLTTATSLGIFTVCPLEPDRPGYKRDVCVAAAKNLVIQNVDRPGCDFVPVQRGPIRSPGRVFRANSEYA